jgi:hypothetical protein
MTTATLQQAFDSTRTMWFASGAPMSRTSTLRRRYVYLWNRLGAAKQARLTFRD